MFLAYKRAALIGAAVLVGWGNARCLAQGVGAAGGPPRIVSTAPAAGARDVDPAVKELTVTFDRDMAKGFSWTGGGADYPPLVEGQRPFWRDARTAVLPVALATGHYYRVGINSKSHRNFRSAAGVPAQPSALYFTTRGPEDELTEKLRKPAVVSMSPSNGAEGVDPQTTELRVTFNVPMGGGFSWTGGGSAYPGLREGEGPRWLDDRRTCVLPVRLEPARQYRLGLNSPSHKNFQSASGVPLEPVAYAFTTVGFTNQTPQPPAHADLSAAGIRVPAKKWPDVSGVVIDGALDTSRPKIEALAACLTAQQEAAQAGDMARYHEIGRQAESNLLNVVAPSRPLPHAAVSLFVRDSGSVRGAQWTATADADGKFEFFDVPQGLYRIVAQDTRNGTNGCPSGELTLEHHRSRAFVRPVVYPQTVTLAGRVTDSHGLPVTNATVSAKQGHASYVETEVDSTRAYHEATSQTDSAGRYELKGLAPAGVWEARGLEGGGYGGANAWYTLKVSAPGYVSAAAHVPVVPETTRLAARTFSGLLKSMASDHAKAGRQKSEPVVQPPCQGHTLTGVDFSLHKPACIDGAFVNKSGTPQPVCTVYLSLTNSVDACSYQAFTDSSHWARCDAEGRFRFDGVAPGAYKVQAYEGNRLVSGNPPLVVTVREGEPVSGLRLANDAPPCGKIVGVVTDAASGKPVKGVTVYAVHKETGATAYPPFLCLCGKVGTHTAECARWIERVTQTNDLRASTFVVENAAPGQTELVLKAPDYAEERLSVDVAPEGVARPKITLWRAGTVRIRPLFKEGARVDCYASVPGTPPLVNYVAIPCEGGKGVRGGRPSKQVGCADFEKLKPGRYILRGAVRYLPGDVCRFETVPAESVSAQTSEVTLDFRGSCGIKLELAFSPGTAVSARLETSDTPAGQDDEKNLGLRATAFFREPGTYLLPDLTPGAYRLSLFCRKMPPVKGQKASAEPDQVKVLTLEEGQAAQTLKYQL